jgi:hypothetical protein
VYDVVSPGEKVVLNFIVEVENVNDPMDDPRIANPQPGYRFQANQSLTLLAVCTDPDTIHGQALNYSWSSNISGHLGYGSSLTLRLQDAGIHVITLTVTDGEFEKMRTVEIEILPREDEPEPVIPNGNGHQEEQNYGLVLGIVVVLVIVGVGFFVVATRRRTERLEEADEEHYMRSQVEHMAKAVKEAADLIENGREDAEVAEAEPSETPAPDEIQVETEAAPSIGLSMTAKETETADAETMALFGRSRAAPPVMSEEEREQLRMDNLKRKYQNAIGRLPYGIPSPELRDWDWVELASVLATGAKKTAPDGSEITEVEGRWYYSDEKDIGTFLKEHGAKPKREEPKKAGVEVTTDKEVLMAKLEERFIMGEISEETYNKLMEKYSEE